MSSSLPLFIAIFCRMTGFFLLSPLLNRVPIPQTIRLCLAIGSSLLVAPSFLSSAASLSWSPLFLLIMIKEVALGYILGLCFALLFESAALAGQIIGTVIGFSATELFDPRSSSSQPLIGKLTMLAIVALFFAFDLHHGWLRIVFESFSLFPIQGSLINANLTAGVIQAMSDFFKTALSYAAFPLIAFFLFVTCLAFFGKMFPESPIFWVGLPAQIIIGTAVLLVALLYFPQILETAYLETKELSQRILFELSSSFGKMSALQRV